MSWDVDEIFLPLLQDCADRLMADPFFAATRMLASGQVISIPVVTENIGDLEAEIAKVLGMVGIVALVELDDGQDIYPDVAGPVINDLRVVVEVCEVGITNRGTRTVPASKGTLKSAGAVVRRAMSLLHHHRPVMCQSPLICTSFSRARYEDVRVGYKATFKTTLALYADVPQVAKPTCYPVNGQYVLSCNTPNAQIFYTLNNTVPAPRTGMFWDGTPITLNQSQRIKARAFLAGYLTSEIVIAP